MPHEPINQHLLNGPAGALDLADVAVTMPPPGWTPTAVEAEVDDVDADDLDENAEA